MSKKRKTRALFLASCAISSQLALGIGLSAPAQASVWNCTTGVSSVGPWGKCFNSDTGYYRAKMNCRNFFTKVWTKVAVGPRQSTTSQQPSVVPGCGLGEEFYGSVWMTEG